MTQEKTKKKSKAKGFTAKAKKKTAIARAVARKGTGVIRINKRNLNTFEPELVRHFISEPMDISKPLSDDVNITVFVEGSGFMSQAVACRTAIAKALVAYKKDEKLKKKFLAYDRALLVDDVRRKESKKQLGVGARRKKQKSKR
ncbi:MAG: 30S ribosomal protein S9 [Candidatus Diapherotrites archaeon]|uniref:30S ribosomal protein S9 n=1 Tax=Candidatus Iainarchaeum sp. TaxID=3101447 RepID=A0A8T4LBM1_9ARCH|nr:30S ribosomal protein S9 [Candidatus Diapherotrites archaeon]